MWKQFLNNPKVRNVGDCTVRALSKALGQSWRETYLGLALKGLEVADMPSSNSVWGSYLYDNGFERTIPEQHDCTVAEFATSHPHGTYVLALSGHVVCLIDGDWYDSWRSDNEIVIYVWSKEEK